MYERYYENKQEVSLRKIIVEANMFLSLLNKDNGIVKRYTMI